jgi:hypothetical protein
MAATSVALVLAAACGGGKAGLSSGYVQRANAVCGEWTKALNDLGGSPALGDVSRMVTFSRQLVTIDQGYTDRFKAIPASKSERPLLTPVYSSFDTINNAEMQTMTAAQHGDRAGIQSSHQLAVDETKRVNVRLKALSLNVCAS